MTPDSIHRRGDGVLLQSDNNYQKAYQLLFDHFGPQGWWPGETAFEIIVGAVLTQNTSWSNVEKAIARLKDAGLLEHQRLLGLEQGEIAAYIRPSGYYNLKAKRLKNLLQMIENKYDGELGLLFADDISTSRKNLLAVKGIGPETADSILLYGGGHPVFVVDAYTHRVFSRHLLSEEETDYDTLQAIFLDNLELDADLFNEYHALIVRVAVTYCRKSHPLCESCPLQGLNL
ncbi:MAG: endonuclease III domain-containing protein [Desulforhopalus sp.]